MGAEGGGLASRGGRRACSRGARERRKIVLGWYMAWEIWSEYLRWRCGAVFLATRGGACDAADLDAAPFSALLSPYSPFLPIRGPLFGNNITDIRLRHSKISRDLLVKRKPSRRYENFEEFWIFERKKFAIFSIKTRRLWESVSIRFEKGCQTGFYQRLTFFCL